MKQIESKGRLREREKDQRRSKGMKSSNTKKVRKNEKEMNETQKGNKKTG